MSSANHRMKAGVASVFHMAGPRKRPAETSRTSSWIFRIKAGLSSGVLVVNRIELCMQAS